KRLCPSMAAVSPERYWFAGSNDSSPDVVYKNESATPDTIAGVNQDYTVANNHFVSEGRFISEGDVRSGSSVVVIGHSIGEALFPRADPIGKPVSISGRKYLVVGVMEKQGA